MKIGKYHENYLTKEDAKLLRKLAHAEQDDLKTAVEHYADECTADNVVVAVTGITLAAVSFCLVRALCHKMSRHMNNYNNSFIESEGKEE